MTQNENAEIEQKERNERLDKLKQDLLQVQATSRLEREKVEKTHHDLLKMTIECNNEYDADLKKQKHEMKLELEKILEKHKKSIANVKTSQENYILKAKEDIENLIKQYEELCKQREGISKKQEEDHDGELQRIE